jgi:outer membrane protein assembly factor BamB
MGRRRALAALAGMAAGGLAVAGWELTRPGRPAAAGGSLAASHAAKPHPPGAMVWRSPVSAPVASVVVAGQTVYAGTAQDTVYALDAAAGGLMWRRVTTHAINDQLVVAGNSVVIADADKGGVIALNAASGRQRWSVSSGAVLGLAATDGIVYAGVTLHSNDTGGVTALSADRGEVIWTITFPQSVDTNGSLTVSGGGVYVTTSDGEIMAYRAADGTRLWRIAGPNVTFSAAPPVVAGGVVYACSGNNTPVLYAVKAANGRLLWRQPLGASALPADVAVADDVVFVGMTRIINAQGLNAGDVSALNAASGQQLWKNRVAGGVDFWPATAPGVVYTGSNNGVLDAWQADTGNHLWSFSTGGLIGSNIALAGGILYFGSNDNHVYAVAAGL